jgi:hypothetical protein
MMARSRRTADPAEDTNEETLRHSTRQKKPTGRAAQYQEDVAKGTAKKLSRDSRKSNNGSKKNHEDSRNESGNVIWPKSYHIAKNYMRTPTLTCCISILFRLR